jgi:hypothetical protein
VLQRGWQAAGGVSAGRELAAAGGAVVFACARCGSALLRSELVQYSLWQQLQDLEALTESSSGDDNDDASHGSDQSARAGEREEVLACLLPMLRCARAAVAMNAGLGVADAPTEAVEAFVAARGLGGALLCAAVQLTGCGGCGSEVGGGVGSRRCRRGGPCGRSPATSAKAGGQRRTQHDGGDERDGAPRRLRDAQVHQGRQVWVLSAAKLLPMPK